MDAFKFSLDFSSQNEEIRENLAKRIIHFSVVVCGEKTGKQMFYDFPTFPFCEFQD